MVRLTITVAFTMAFTIWGVMRIVNNVVFDRNCEGYLKRAADANTIELAEKNLAVAVKYLEDNEFTSGYTSILWRTPDEDIGFWYQNLKSSLDELHAIRPDATRLERTNVLMKLRETLLDEGKNIHVTAPRGISVYPGNVGYALWCLSSLPIAAVFLLWYLLENEF